MLASCKRTDVSGTVFSKHNTPIANVQISLRKYNKYEHQVKWVNEIATTDEAGKFAFSFNATQTRAHYYIFICHSDSGQGSGKKRIVPGQTNVIDVLLN